MTLTFTDEQEELRASVRRFLADKSPSEAVRRWMESEEGHDPAVWRQMAEQLGLQGLALPEEYGGAGYGPVELGIVLEEMGRALLPAPFLSSVALAGQALAVSGDDAAKQRWLPGIVDGTRTAALAVSEEGSSWTLEGVRTTATPKGEGWALEGTKTFVIDGGSADLLLVVARTDEGPALFAVEGADGVSRSPLTALDPTRRLAHVTLEAAPAVRVGPAGDQAGYLRDVLDLAIVALAAEQVGAAQACLDLSVEYAKIRVQFGRPIGSFQAIKHKCADMLLEVESAKSAVYNAASVAAERIAGAGEELPIAAALAGAYCSTTAVHAAKETVQIHGGIGYTWEHDAHLYLKRAKSSELLFGAPAAHRARLATLVGI
ncbi:acyl-CoA dehydrogenase family protein [Pseudonocardia pini]|uniref:acyl-CoA dehydrogenase family protein n=1 Tax=Pseudonocardia pini TaxID=2758030 RepID=UPI0028A80FE3|nr:acyl-CoA dehydrogenase family protein [Pseudonocardia pini]